MVFVPRAGVVASPGGDDAPGWLSIELNIEIFVASAWCGGFFVGWFTELFMFDEEGAVNGLADASPADSEGFVPEYGADEDWVYSDDPATEFGEPSFEATGPVNVDEDDSESHRDGREAFIPRDRFDQVHGRAQQLEQELMWQREQNELAQRAMAAGYRDVAQFEHDDAWARANHYEGIEQYRAMQEGPLPPAPSPRLRHPSPIGMGEGPVTVGDAVHGHPVDAAMQAELVRDRQERLRTQQELAQVRGLLQSVQRSSLDQTIASARAQFDHVDPDQWAQIERLCRDIGRPDAVQRVISTFAPAVQSAKRSAAERALIEHNSRRASNGYGAPPPEGRGGGQAPPQLPKVSPQQAKSRLLSELLGFRK